MFDLKAGLDRFFMDDAGEMSSRARFLDLLATTPRCFSRDCHPAHFTASAWLVSADGERTLLMHHRKLDRWLQQGGHADGDADLAVFALRAAREETGLS